MSGIKALEKLRAYEDVERFEDMEPWNIQWLADDIEREIEERYMVLPLDADGVPIHVGDVLEIADSEIEDDGPETVKSVSAGLAWFGGCMGVMGGAFRHVKPRTLEDVLCDMIREYGCTDALTETIADKYAAEIRELMGGDAK